MTNSTKRLKENQNIFDKLLKEHEPKGSTVPPSWIEYVYKIDDLRAQGNYEDALRLEVEHWQKKSNYYFEKFVETNTRLTKLMEKLREYSETK